MTGDEILAALVIAVIAGAIAFAVTTWVTS